MLRLYILAAMTGTSLGLWYFLPYFILDLEGGLLEVGFLATVPGLVAALVQLSIGNAVEASGSSKDLLVLGFLLCATLSIPMLLASSAWSAILVATVLEPFNSITIIWGIPSQLYLTALTPQAWRSRIVAVYYTAWYVGNIAGAFLAGHLAQTNWGLVFAAFAGLNLLSSLFLKHLLPGTGRHEGVRYRDILRSLFDGRTFLNALRQLRARFRGLPREYARFSLGVPIRSVGVSMVMPITAIYLAEVLQAPKPVIATMTAFGMLARIIPAPLVGWIADHWGRKRVFLAGLVLTMLYPAIYVSAPDTTRLYPAYALMGLGWACNQATFLAWQMALVPDRRGTSIALLSFLNNFAWAFGPSIGGLLGEFAGIWWGVIVSILVEAVGLAVLLRVPEAI